MDENELFLLKTMIAEEKDPYRLNLLQKFLKRKSSRDLAKEVNSLGDAEFAEFFVYLCEMIKTDENAKENGLTKEDMESFDISGFLNTLSSILDEIIFSEEIDRGAWWKNTNE